MLHLKILKPVFFMEMLWGGLKKEVNLSINGLNYRMVSIHLLMLKSPLVLQIDSPKECVRFYKRNRDCSE